MMHFDAEWLEVSDVRDPVLAHTWCRLALRVGESVPTRWHSYASGSVRDAVLGSAFPLCRWLVTNWWSLIYESMPSESLTSGVRANLSERHRTWLTRHGLLFARDGFALPDLVMFRDETDLHVAWCEDPQNTGVDARGRFVTSGTERVPLAEARTAIATFVDAVLDRLEGFDDTEVADLRSDWEATRALSEAQQHELIPVAAVGLDPFDLDDEHWTWFEQINERLAEVPSRTAFELLAATTEQSLAADVDGVARTKPTARRQRPRHGSGVGPCPTRNA